jgi:hypothetical protein
MTRNPKHNKSLPFRQPINRADPASYDKLHLRIQFDLLDFDHDLWGWKRLTKEEHLEFLRFIKSMETLTWAQIKLTAGGKGEGKGTNHHPIEIYKLRPIAQDRLHELNLHRIIGDTVFSLRLNNISRIYGGRDEQYFRPIWHDPFHDNQKSVYPLAK